MPIFLLQEVSLSPIAVNFVLAGTPLLLALCSVLGSPVSRVLGELPDPTAFQEDVAAELMSPQHQASVLLPCWLVAPWGTTSASLDILGAFEPEHEQSAACSCCHLQGMALPYLQDGCRPFFSSSCLGSPCWPSWACTPPSGGSRG